MSNLVLYSIPAFIVLLLLELAWSRRAQRQARDIRGYATKDTIASLSMGLINVVIAGGAKFLSIPFFAILYEHRFVDVVAATGGWAWVILLVVEDHSYYWFHRMHHEVRLLWACHVNHHSSQYYNLSTALRQAVLTPISGPIFWAPLPLIGFPPWMVLTAQAWSLLYQFWLHTEAIDKLGPIEWVMNTPSHHRVHHGKNVEYLDKNHAGIFIIWDKLFGTFAPEEKRVVYGLTKDIDSFNLGVIAFHEYAAIARDVRSARTWSARFGYVLRGPGWAPAASDPSAAAPAPARPSAPVEAVQAA